MDFENTLTIAVDFDGTIVEHKFPQIGKEMLFAFQTLKSLHEKGHRIILWTFRHGLALDEAVEYCQKNGLEFYAINRSHPDENFDPKEASRKLEADLFIDDRNFGGFPGWGRIWALIYPEGDPNKVNYQPIYPEDHYNKSPKKGILKRLFP
ncbi:MAG: hypothetical protein ACJAY8_000046 [Sphingobacteriales bacterium]|jgi:hypothetical protein